MKLALFCLYQAEKHVTLTQKHRLHKILISIFPNNVLYHLNNCGCYTVLFFCRTRWHLGNYSSLRRNMLYREREETEIPYTFHLQHNTQWPEQMTQPQCVHVSACTRKQDMYAFVHAHTHAQIFLKSAIFTFYIHCIKRMCQKNILRPTCN